MPATFFKLKQNTFKRKLRPTKCNYHGSLCQASKFQEIRDDLPIVGIINILKEVEVVVYEIFRNIDEKLQCEDQRQFEEDTFLQYN